MPNKKITYIVFIMIITTTCLFPAEYVVKIDNMELGRVRTQWTKNGWICISEIQYGEKYVVETRTLYGKGGRFDMYEAIFKTNNEIVAKILGVNKMGKTSITLYAYYDPKSPSVKTFNFNTSDLVLLDNNFIIPHFEMMLRVPQPVMNIIIPQALFNPSKTEKATGVAEMKRLPDGKYTLSYEGTVITITSDNFGIVKMEYSNGIIVERVKK
ncbi:MAG: hypothetical protein N2Z58_01815 [Fervidobacterium sp.]|nr:hypothetical protein [Fervidobacterium sp.]